MNVNEINNMEKWNYNQPIPQPLWDAQTDWNQTLVTKFNFLSVGVKGRVLIKVPKKFKNLIESLLFYDNNNLTISQKYDVEFTDSDTNVIIVGEKEVEIENFN
jgi:hypothetical protein